jgi:NCAIR mutase (PurE)-related protein
VSDFQLDWARRERTGLDEAVLCEPKSTAQIEAIVRHAIDSGRRLLLTRLTAERFGELPADMRALLDHDSDSRTAILGGPAATVGSGRIAIVAAGTSDAPVAREALRTLAFAGEDATLMVDVGVAGLWRLMDRIEAIRQHQVTIVVAGMEGALFSVVAGLVPGPVVALPTSIGYGVAHGGTVALHAALASCSSGIVTVNIDNGFGAAHAALRMLGASQRA